MSTKITSLEQHNLLHTQWPHDCCLCKLEKHVESMTTRQEIADELAEALPDLIQQYFPKEECQERGEAIVLGAMLVMKVKGVDINGKS